MMNIWIRYFTPLQTCVLCLCIRSRNELSWKRLGKRLLKQRNVNVISKNSVNPCKCKNSKNAKRRNAQPSRKSKLSRKVSLRQDPWLIVERQDGNTLTTEDDFEVELDNAANEGRR